MKPAEWVVLTSLAAASGVVPWQILAWNGGFCFYVVCTVYCILQMVFYLGFVRFAVK